MATATLIPVQQYLRSDYEPDAEYVDGEVEQRPVGEYDHSTWQFALQKYFDQHATGWGIRVRCELRVQVTPTRFRVPDVVVFDRHRPIEQILTHPPIAVFEVLSPEDSMSRMLIKLADYEAMGIPNIFVLDPKLERIYRYAAGNLQSAKPREPLTNTLATIDWQVIADLRD